MSDYILENRDQLIPALQERVLSNAPLREIIRVYNEALTAAIGQLNDADLARSVFAAGYMDLVEVFNLEEPPAPEATEEAPAEAEA